MSLPLHQLRDEALRLPEQQRRALVEDLLDSMDGTGDPTAWEEAWVEELRRRSGQGHDDAVPWPEVKAGVLKRIGRS